VEVLVSFVGGRGHLDPLRPLADALVARGHAVRVAGRPSMEGAVAAAGHRFVAVGPDVTPPDAITPLAPPDPAREVRVLRDGFADRTARWRAADLLAVGERARPDLLIADELDFGALVAAEVLGIPRAVVIVSAAGDFVRPEVVRRPLEVVRAEHGLDDDVDSMLHGELVVAPLPPSFRAPAHPLPVGTIWTRPAVLEAGVAPSVWTDRRPRIHVTLGTIFNLESGDLFDRLLDAVQPVDAHVVVTVGDGVDPSTLAPAAPHVDMASFLPPASVFRGADVVISHGGSGTVVSAMSCGAVQLLLPMGADQPDNARRCEALGVGAAVDPQHATPTDIRQAVVRLLDDEECRGRARALAAEADRLPPAIDVVPRLEELAG